MSIHSSVYPSCGSPGKYQMEELFRDIEPTPQMIENFGLVREGDEWRITVSLDKARKCFVKLYSTLSNKEKLDFQFRFFAGGINYLSEILTNMEAAGLSLKDEKELIAKLFMDVAKKP